MQRVGGCDRGSWGIKGKIDFLKNRMIRRFGCLLNVADQAFAEVTLIIPTNDLGIPFRPFGMSLSRLFLAKFEGMGGRANTQNGVAGFDERSDHLHGLFRKRSSADADNEQVGLGNEESVG